MKKYVFILLALMVYLSIVYVWLFNKRLKVKNNSNFINMDVACIITTLVSFLFTFLCFNNKFANESLRNLTAKFYIIFVMDFSALILNYIISKILMENQNENANKLFKKMTIFLIVAALFDTLVVLILPITVNVVSSEYSINIGGDAFYAVFFMMAVYLIMIIAVLIYYRKRTNIWTKLSFISCFVLWIIAFILYYLFHMPGTLDLTNAFILLLMFLIVENPANKLDLETGCFLDSYTNYYVDNLIESDANFYFTIIDVESINKTKKSEENLKSARDIYVKKAIANRNNTCFISSYNELTIITKKIENLNRIVNDFINQTSLMTNIKAKCITFIPNKIKFNDINEFDKVREVAKEKVRNAKEDFIKFEINDKVIEEIRNEEYIVEEINKALEEHRIVAYIQPLYSVEKARIVAAESLTRLIKTDGTIMAPYQYIPIAEKSNQIIKIGERMFENVCEILTNKKYDNLNLDYIDVNLSVVQCEQEDLADNLITIAQKYRLDPKRINFEITESGVISSLTPIIKNIVKLTDYGFGFSLDDFGTGESNINYLFEMPVLYIKLDNHLIWKYFDDDKAKQTIRSIVKISHFLNLKVVAEGVETEEQFKELIKQGIDLIQGYYFFKPMSPDDYLKIVDKKEG